MGENTRFYIIIIILAGIVLLQFLLKPKPAETPFDKTFKEIQATLDTFKLRNQEIKDASKTLAEQQAKAEARYDLIRQDFQNKLDAIQVQIGFARSQYAVLLGKLGELNDKFKDSGAPDSIPTLDQLVKGN